MKLHFLCLLGLTVLEASYNGVPHVANGPDPPAARAREYFRAAPGAGGAQLLEGGVTADSEPRFVERSTEHARAPVSGGDAMGRRALIGDFNGDGASDWLDVRDDGGATLALGRADALGSQRGGGRRGTDVTFDVEEVILFDKPFTASRAHLSVCDVDGDGRDDVVLLDALGAHQVGLSILPEPPHDAMSSPTAPDAAFEPVSPVRGLETYRFCAGRSELACARVRVGRAERGGGCAIFVVQPDANNALLLAGGHDANGDVFFTLRHPLRLHDEEFSAVPTRLSDLATLAGRSMPPPSTFAPTPAPTPEGQGQRPGTPTPNPPPFSTNRTRVHDDGSGCELFNNDQGRCSGSCTWTALSGGLAGEGTCCGPTTVSFDGKCTMARGCASHNNNKPKCVADQGPGSNACNWKETTAGSCYGTPTTGSAPCADHRVGTICTGFGCTWDPAAKGICAPASGCAVHSTHEAACLADRGPLSTNKCAWMVPTKCVRQRDCSISPTCNDPYYDNFCKDQTPQNRAGNPQPLTRWMSLLTTQPLTDWHGLTCTDVRCTTARDVGQGICAAAVGCSKWDMDERGCNAATGAASALKCSWVQDTHEAAPPGAGVCVDAEGCAVHNQDEAGCATGFSNRPCQWHPSSLVGNGTCAEPSGCARFSHDETKCQNGRDSASGPVLDCVFTPQAQCNTLGHGDCAKVQGCTWDGTACSGTPIVTLPSTCTAKSDLCAQHHNHETNCKVAIHNCVWTRLYEPGKGICCATSDVTLNGTTAAGCRAHTKQAKCELDVGPGSNDCKWTPGAVTSPDSNAGKCVHAKTAPAPLGTCPAVTECTKSNNDRGGCVAQGADCVWTAIGNKGEGRCERAVGCQRHRDNKTACLAHIAQCMWTGSEAMGAGTGTCLPSGCARWNNDEEACLKDRGAGSNKCAWTPTFGGSGTCATATGCARHDLDQAACEADSGVLAGPNKCVWRASLNKCVPGVGCERHNNDEAACVADTGVNSNRCAWTPGPASGPESDKGTCDLATGCRSYDNDEAGCVDPCHWSARVLAGDHREGGWSGLGACCEKTERTAGGDCFRLPVRRSILHSQPTAGHRPLAAPSEKLLGFNALHTAVLVADFDGDGRDDLVTFDRDGHHRAALNRGGGNFEVVPNSAARARGEGIAGLYYGLGEGIVGTNGEAEGYVLATANSERGSTTPCGFGCAFVASGDFNGDGRADIIALQADGRHALFLSQGTGHGALSFSRFQPVQGLRELKFRDTSASALDSARDGSAALDAAPRGAGAAALRVADFNGDGLDDLLVLNTNMTADATKRDNFLLATSNGDGSFSLTYPAQTGLRKPDVRAGTDLAHSVAAVVVAGDWDGSGMCDFAVLQADGSHYVALNAGKRVLVPPAYSHERTNQFFSGDQPQARWYRDRNRINEHEYQSTTQGTSR